MRTEIRRSWNQQVKGNTRSVEIRRSIPPLHISWFDLEKRKFSAPYPCLHLHRIVLTQNAWSMWSCLFYASCSAYSLSLYIHVCMHPCSNAVPRLEAWYHFSCQVLQDEIYQDMARLAPTLQQTPRVYAFLSNTIRIWQAHCATLLILFNGRIIWFI